MLRTSIHVHTDRDSNLHSPDSVVKIPDLVEKLKEMNFESCAITGHDSLSGHYRFWKECNKNGIKPMLGWEAYLDLEDEWKYHHMIIIAKNQRGLINLRELSTKAWLENYYYRPRIKMEWLKEFGQDLIFTDACLGGFVKRYLKNMSVAEESGNQDEAKMWLKRLDDGIKNVLSYTKDFYIELQAGLQKEQVAANIRLVDVAKHYGLKLVCSTDVHYLRPEDKDLHKMFLRSKDDSERELGEFYDYTYLMTHEEVVNIFKTHLDEETINEMIKNTNALADMVDEYDLSSPPILPDIKDMDIKFNGYFDKYLDEYEYINKYYHSDSDVDRYWLSVIEAGHVENITYDSKYDSKLYVDRIEEELKTIWLVGEKIGNKMSQYYVSDYIHIKLAAKAGSLTGVARGSAGALYTCYCAGSIQLDPVEYNLPIKRHVDELRAELADKDNDHQPEKKSAIMEEVKNYHGEDRVISVCTFGTVSSKSAIATAGRALGADYIKPTTVKKITSLVPMDRGVNWTIKQCLEGEDGKGYEPVEAMVKYSKQYPELFEYAEKMTGLIDKRSQHASAVNVYNDRYTKYNAAMKTPKGEIVTQYEMHDSEEQGAVKYDFLYTEQQTKKALALESIGKKYEELLHPRVLNLNDSDVYENIFHIGRTKTIFQWETPIGIEALKKLKPSNILELTAGNNLIRLIGDGIEKFSRYKQDPEAFDRDYDYLTDDERGLIKSTLYRSCCVGITQEDIMDLSMQIGFDRTASNRLRKSIAKKIPKLLEQEHEELFKVGRQNGFRELFLETIWKDFIEPLKGYAFSIIHGVAYSIEGYQSAYLLNYYPLHWYKACLTVASGALDMEAAESKSADYGKLATTIANIQGENVNIMNPYIDRSGYGFEIVEDGLMFGLKGINRVGDWCADQIMRNRPYSSFEDFINKNVKDVAEGDKPLERRIVMSLIGAGCFDNVEPDKKRKDLFIDYIKLTHKNVKQVDVRQYNELCGYKVAPTGLEKEDAAAYIKANKEKLVTELNRHRMNSVWQEMLKNDLKGNEADWEFEAMNIYIQEHPMNCIKSSLTEFESLPDDTPFVMKSFIDKNKNEVKYRQYEVSRLGGTVLNRKNEKKFVEILTPHGEVVMIKFYENDWDKYNDILKRGNKLIVHGYRWNGHFKPKLYGNKKFKSVELLEDYIKKI